MMGASQPVATERGTRPGDPLADLLYAFAMAGALKDIEQGLHDEGITPSLHLAGVLTPNPPAALAPSVSWHDDAAFMFCSDRAKDLEVAASTCARIVWAAFHSRGLALSFAPSKTELLLTPCGPGCDKVNRLHVCQKGPRYLLSS